MRVDERGRKIKNVGRTKKKESERMKKWVCAETVLKISNFCKPSSVLGFRLKSRINKVVTCIIQCNRKRGSLD